MIRIDENLHDATFRKPEPRGYPRVSRFAALLVPIRLPNAAELPRCAPVALTFHEHTEEATMSHKNRAVFGIYASAEHAERAVNALVNDGFASQDVSVLMPDTESTRAFAHRKETKAPEGATAGATAGGIVGGTLGVLVALGSLAIPGVGPLIAAGPLLAGLAGLGAGGAVGGLIGGLVGAGIPEYEARRYAGRVEKGGVLLSVHAETDGEVLRAKEILRETGADDIATAGEAAATRAEAAPTTQRHPTP
jgi:hypothetical protein